MRLGAHPALGPRPQAGRSPRLLVGLRRWSWPGRSPVTSSGHSGTQPRQVFQKVSLSPTWSLGGASEPPQPVSAVLGLGDRSAGQDLGWVPGPRPGEMLGPTPSARAGQGWLLLCHLLPGSSRLGPSTPASAPRDLGQALGSSLEQPQIHFGASAETASASQWASFTCVAPTVCQAPWRTAWGGAACPVPARPDGTEQP